MNVKTGIIHEIISTLGEKASTHIIEELRVGLCYTAVLLTNGQVGLAYTFRRSQLSSCNAQLEAGTMRGKNAGEVMRLACSEDLVASSIGIATINALANPETSEFIDGDVLKAVDFRKGDRVGLVVFSSPWEAAPVSTAVSSDLSILAKRRDNRSRFSYTDRIYIHSAVFLCCMVRR